MKRLIVGTLAAIGLATSALAARETVNLNLAQSYEPVDSIPALVRLHSWHAIDDDTLIVWATPFKPYLVELTRPSPDLKFANVIGVSEFAGRVHSRFDTVYIRGIHYRIGEIYELSREQAKALVAS